MMKRVKIVGVRTFSGTGGTSTTTTTTTTKHNTPTQRSLQTDSPTRRHGRRRMKRRIRDETNVWQTPITTWRVWTGDDANNQLHRCEPHKLTYKLTQYRCIGATEENIGPRRGRMEHVLWSCCDESDLAWSKSSQRRRHDVHRTQGCPAVRTICVRALGCLLSASQVSVILQWMSAILQMVAAILQ